MSDKRQETIADIVAKKRRIADEIEASANGIPNQFQRELIADLRKDADSLEAAWGRECVEIATSGGNSAAMREALEPWIAFAEWLLENAGKDGLGKAIQENGPIIRQRLEELRDALAAPPRNCDVGTADDWLARFSVVCERCSGSDCDHRLFKDEEVCDCFARWLQMPYEKGVPNAEEKEKSC